MSVRIKLNSRKFFGEGLLIGSRLNEGEVTQQTVDTSTQNASTDASTQTTPNASTAQNNQ